LNHGGTRRRRDGDAGMTLPEVLIAVAMLGLLVAVISGALVVTMRQQSSTEGRLNVARSEQSVGLWLPGDLASAGVVSVEPDWSPCGHIEVDGEWEATGVECPPLGLPAGSNALMLGWSYKDADGNVTYTNVSYQFYQDSDGTFSLARVECVLSGGAWSCSHLVVLSELSSPPVGTTWEPGVTRPFWVIEVSQPLAALATSEDQLAQGETKNAKRVIVTIDGGGTVADAGGGVNRISITAGGTTRRVIDGSSMVGAPSFVEARSLCGGPMSLLIDESNSIGRPGSGGSATAVNNVKQGVRDFVNALTGTPVKLQVIGFHTFSHALGTTEWHRYFDMANETEVAELLAAIDTLRFDWSTAGNPNGGTNWEEGLFRAFYTEEGLTAEPVPNKVVFFTDGVPTFDRLVHRTGTLPDNPPDPGPAWADSNGSAYSQVAFDRADFIAREFRGPIDLIGVGVGGISSGTENWVSSPQVGYRTVWYRAYRQYQRTQTGTVYEKASSLSSNLDFEEYDSGWENTDPNDYFSYNWSSHTSQFRGETNDNRPRDNRRIDDDNGWRRSGWSSVSYTNVKNNLNLRSILGLSSEWYRIDSWSGDQGQAAYDAAPQAEKDAGLWRQRTATTTTWVSKAQYDANNTTPDGSDGWTALPAPEYVSASAGTDWVEWPGSRSSYPSDQFRSEDIEGVPPYDGYRPVQTVPVPRTEILARLIGDAVPPTIGPDGQYDNAKQATLYSTPDWTQLPKALKAIALGDCGGTLTLQTRLGGSGAPDPFRYQATNQFAADGTELTTDRPVVYTNREQTTGNFDLAIESGLFRDVVIMPENYSDLRSYQPTGWSCRAGAETRAFELVDIPGDETSPWKGIKVRVAANEAVSCIQTVTR
jgi:prepilin-type N-terminal cleavage/methylation domain-containing protein